MLYMLDTDICSYIMKKNPLTVLEKLEAKVKQGNEICISSITYAELLLGAKRAVNSEKILQLIEAFCERLHSIQAWDDIAAEKFSDLQSFLFKKGQPIGVNDTLIASHALALQAVLVTNNTRHFSKVPNLLLRNWV